MACSPTHASGITRRTIRVKEAEAVYGLKKTTLFQLLRRKEIQSVKIGGVRLVLVDSIEALIRSKGTSGVP